jgi:hypothetical protein
MTARVAVYKQVKGGHVKLESHSLCVELPKGKPSTFGYIELWDEGRLVEVRSLDVDPQLKNWRLHLSSPTKP